MKILRGLAILAAAALLGGALAEPVETEYLVDLTREEVRQMEERLSKLGYLSIEADEIYDASTRQAIESFQQANGLEVTGEANAATLERLNGEEAVSRQDYLRRFANAYAEMTPLEKGANNNQVLVMQRRLKDYGYFSGTCDGVFGDATRMAVESFQMVNGLRVTGVADGAMLMRLMADSPISWPGFLSEMSATAGDTGLNVYVLQKKLRGMGYFSGECTGSYGELTQRAVTRFQEENNLEPTGIADGATWAVIYSGAAVAPRSESVLQPGDYGSRVSELQQRLAELGYYAQPGSGQFTLATETAVRLFQMAANLPATGEADEAMFERLMAEDAPALGDEAVQAEFQNLIGRADGDVQRTLAEIASHMLGTAFGEAEDDLYPGYSFVQYVCVVAGLPISAPEDIIGMAEATLEDSTEAEAGSIVALQSAEGDRVTLLMTIAAGDGKVIHTAGEGGWVVLSFMDQMESSHVYCWDAEA